MAYKSQFSQTISQINEATQADQKMRKMVFSKDAEANGTLRHRLDALDKKNTNLLKKVLEKISLPTISRTGKRTSCNAWLIVQHSQDLQFQKKYLRLLKINKDDIDKRNIAYLEDRILRREGKPQKYGTQILFNPLTKKHKPQETQNPERLDLRRKRFGLKPIRDYLNQADNHLFT